MRNKVLVFCVGVLLLVLLGAGVMLLSGKWVVAPDLNFISPGVMPAVGDGIEIQSPVLNELIQEAPLLIRGRAKGTWYFEASFTAELFDGNENFLGRAILTAKEDWMTEDFVPFEGKLYFDLPTSGSLKLKFLSDNPSGLPENQKTFELPLKYDLDKTSAVKVFFLNENDANDPEKGCVQTYPLTRQIPYTKEVARYALTELLQGPTVQEQAADYYSSIYNFVEPKTVQLRSIKIESGVAYADFTQIDDGGSCRVAGISRQIVDTLKQFSSVQEVVITLNGYGVGPDEYVLQP